MVTRVHGCHPSFHAGCESQVHEPDCQHQFERHFQRAGCRIGCAVFGTKRRICDGIGGRAGSAKSPAEFGTWDRRSCGDRHFGPDCAGKCSGPRDGCARRSREKTVEQRSCGCGESYSVHESGGAFLSAAGSFSFCDCFSCALCSFGCGAGCGGREHAAKWNNGSAGFPWNFFSPAELRGRPEPSHAPGKFQCCETAGECD